MAEMQSGSCLLCQQDVSCHDHILNRIADALPAFGFHILICIHDTALYQIDVLTMSQNRDIMRFCDFHGLPVKPGIHNRLSILTDGRRTGFYHALNI